MRYGTPVEREHLCLTISFDHDLIDGAPAARFTMRFAERLSGGDALVDEVERSWRRPTQQLRGAPGGE